MGLNLSLSKKQTIFTLTRRPIRWSSACSPSTGTATVMIVRVQAYSAGTGFRPPITLSRSLATAVRAISPCRLQSHGQRESVVFDHPLDTFVSGARDHACQWPLQTLELR